MKTEKEIISDLDDIKFYSLRKNSITMISSEKKRDVEDKVRIYNDKLKNAPLKLYLLYVDVYLKHNKMVTVAIEWDKSNSYINDLHKKLIQFFIKEFSKEEKANVG